MQQWIDAQYAADALPEPASIEFIRHLHREFYRDAPATMLRIDGDARSDLMKAGEMRSRREHDNVVGRHQPPGSDRVQVFMKYFQKRYAFRAWSPATRLLALAAAHHRFNFIHPFPDGNGRVSRLMSHAMALQAGIGAHGLWSISRGLARGLAHPSEYKSNMDDADSPRQGDLDGRGNLSQRALAIFTTWFLKVCLDQVRFMRELFELNRLSDRLQRYAAMNDWRDEAARLLIEILHRGEIARGDAALITGLSERTSRDILRTLIDNGVVGSIIPKGPVSLRFPVKSLDVLFPRLFLQT